jgi:transposase-like protein
MYNDPMSKPRRSPRGKKLEPQCPIITALPAACADETLAVEFMEKQRWGDSPGCPRCGDTEVNKMLDKNGTRNKRYLWRCHGCKEQYTVRIGTIMEESRIPLRHWCYAFWAACASKKGVSALQIRRQTKLSYKSALYLMHRIRLAMTPTEPNPPKLRGTVEADETYVGGKPRPASLPVRKAFGAGGPTRRRMPYGGGVHQKVPVVALIQRGGAVRAMVMPVVTSEGIREALIENVESSARLMTDEGRHYTNVGREFAYHGRVKHSKYEYVRGDNHVNTAENFFSRLKRQLYGTHHAVSKQHLHRYVAEVVFKHNTRNLDDGPRVIAAIHAAEGKRLRYKEPLFDPRSA